MVIGLVAILAPFIAPYGDASIDLTATLAGASARHLLGTDQLGRDTLTRAIWGDRTSMTIAIGAPLIGLVIGMPLGIIAVSYTHLDVYKRQTSPMCSSTPGCGSRACRDDRGTPTRLFRGHCWPSQWQLLARRLVPLPPKPPRPGRRRCSRSDRAGGDLSLIHI